MPDNARDAADKRAQDALIAAMRRYSSPVQNVDWCAVAKQMTRELAEAYAENERLRAALEQFADDENWFIDRRAGATYYNWLGSNHPRQLAADALKGRD